MLRDTRPARAMGEAHNARLQGARERESGVRRELIALAALILAPVCAASELATWPPCTPGVKSVWASDCNGRVFRVRPLVKHGPGARFTGNPGADAYGAYGEEDQQVYVKVGQTVVTINPWERITRSGAKQFERARQQWLRERGYVGGVRTHRRSRYEGVALIRLTKATERPKVEVEPRATIRIPEGARRKRGFHVDAGPGGSEMRISWPMNVPADVRALSEAPAEKGVEVASEASKAE